MSDPAARATRVIPVAPAAAKPAAGDAAVSAPVGATSATAAGRGTRRARLRLVRIDPWSVMKTSFLLSTAFGIVIIVSVLIVWGVLGAAGVWDSLNQTIQEVVGGKNSAFQVEDYLGIGRVLGFTIVIAIVDVVLLTAIATLGAFLYNMAAALLGGIDVTFSETER